MCGHIHLRESNVRDAATMATSHREGYHILGGTDSVILVAVLASLPPSELLQAVEGGRGAGNSAPKQTSSKNAFSKSSSAPQRALRRGPPP